MYTSKARSPWPMTVSADGDPGVVVAEDTGILLVSGRIGGDFAKVEVIGGVRRLLKDNAVFGIEALFYGSHGLLGIAFFYADAGQYAEALGFDEDLAFLTFFGTDLLHRKRHRHEGTIRRPSLR